MEDLAKNVFDFAHVMTSLIGWVVVAGFMTWLIAMKIFKKWHFRQDKPEEEQLQTAPRYDGRSIELGQYVNEIA